MQVLILKDTDYEPTSSDGPRCYGQLRKRVSRIEKDGKTLPGPMVHHFKAGAKPELRDDVAAVLIAAGNAEPFDGAEVRFVSREQILQEAFP